MTSAPKLFPPVGYCIYCWARGPGMKLTDEHIIPYSMGGREILPESSCLQCSAITGAFEGQCVEAQFQHVRAHLGLRSRKRGLLKGAPVIIDGQKQQLPTDEHPSMYMSFKFPLPGLIRNEPDVERVNARIFMASMVPNFKQRLDRLGRRHVNLAPRDMVPLTLARVVAKIGHAWAVANLGGVKFAPFLRQVILQGHERRAAQLIGTLEREGPLVESPMHSVALITVRHRGYVL